MNFTLKILNKAKILLFMVLIVIPIHFLLAVPIILVAVPFCTLVWIWAKIIDPDLQGFVTGEQAGFAYKDSSRAAQNILVKTVWEGSVDVGQCRKDFQSNIFDSPSNRLVYSGLQNTWTSFLGYAFWKRDTEFNLENHIREYNYGGELAIPRPCTEADIHGVLGSLLEAPWNRKRSPWEILLVPNCELDGTLRTVLLMRIDHALCDGYSLVQLFEKAFQTSFSFPKINLGNKTQPFWSRLWRVFRLPYDLAENSLMISGSSTLQHRKSSSEEAIVVVGPSVDIDVIRKIKDHFRVNFAAVVYSAILGGIKRCLKSSDQKIPGSLTMGFVVPKPNHPGGLCVHAAMIASKWPINSESPEERLLKIQRDVVSLSQSTVPMYATIFIKTVAYFPMIIRKMCMEFITGRGISAGITSFPVTKGPVFYNGHEMVELTGCVGTWSNFRLMFTSGGVNNKQRLCVTVSKNIFATENAARNLGEFVNEELQALLQATV